MSRLHVRQVPTSCHLCFKILPPKALYMQQVLWFHEVKSVSMERRYWMAFGKEQLLNTPFICGVSWCDWLHLWTKKKRSWETIRARTTGRSKKNICSQPYINLMCFPAIGHTTHNSTLTADATQRHPLHILLQLPFRNDDKLLPATFHLSGTDDKLLPATFQSSRNVNINWKSVGMRDTTMMNDFVLSREKVFRTFSSAESTVADAVY